MKEAFSRDKAAIWYKKADILKGQKRTVSGTKEDR
jgi:hypothetical protein